MTTDRIIPSEKYCPKCKTVKLRADWNRGSNKADGLQSYCRECNKEYRKVLDTKYAQVLKERRRAYYLAHPEMKEQARIRMRERRSQATKYRKENWLRIRARNFKLKNPTVQATIEEVMELIKSNPDCAICHRPNDPKRPHNIDHCHKTHKIRAILCPRCNSALGFFEDDPELFRAAILFLEKHKP